MSPKAHNVIKARLAGLPETENQVLNCLSVFPEKTAIEELELLLPDMDRLTLIRALEKLQERHLIKESLIGWNIFTNLYTESLGNASMNDRARASGVCIIECWRNTMKTGKCKSESGRASYGDLSL